MNSAIYIDQFATLIKCLSSNYSNEIQVINQGIIIFQTNDTLFQYPQSNWLPLRIDFAFRENKKREKSAKTVLRFY